MAARGLFLLCHVAILLAPTSAYERHVSVAGWKMSVPWHYGMQEKARTRVQARDSLRRVAKKLNRIADNGTAEIPARARIWTMDGPSLTEVEVPPDGRLPVDSSLCALEMNDTSRPISDAQFLASKFLAVYHLPEQLSKARLHMIEALFIAQKTRRILILPRVGRSKIDMFQPYPFCTYFDVNRLGTRVRWVTYEFYVAAMLRLGVVPRVRYLCVTRTSMARSFLPCRTEVESTQTYRGLPLMALTHGVPPNATNTLTFLHYYSDGWLPPGGFPMDEFFERVEPLKADLLVLSKMTFWNVSSERFLARKHDVRFAPQLVELAKQAGDEFGPNYVGVHLRWEWIGHQTRSTNVIGRNTVKCCKGLRKLIRHPESFRLSWANSRVYFASDVSPKSFDVYSNSFSDPEKAIKCLRGLVNESNALSLEDFQALSNRTSSTYEFLDYGLKGILDKLICGLAKHFVSGPAACGGGHSFEQEILYYRSVFRLPMGSHQRWKLSRG